MREVRTQTKFQADVKRLNRSRRIDFETLRYVFREVEAGEDVPASLKPHPLRGDWAGWWEFHLDADLLVIYRLTETAAIFYRLGTHAQLFGKR
ncbi:MAG: type II toxin-antitoxin system RelE/ParE family toxin [Stenotrophobium sp.]